MPNTAPDAAHGTLEMWIALRLSRNRRVVNMNQGLDKKAGSQRLVKGGCMYLIDIQTCTRGRAQRSIRACALACNMHAR